MNVMLWWQKKWMDGNIFDIERIIFCLVCFSYLLLVLFLNCWLGRLFWKIKWKKQKKVIVSDNVVVVMVVIMMMIIKKGMRKKKMKIFSLCTMMMMMVIWDPLQESSLGNKLLFYYHHDDHGPNWNVCWGCWNARTLMMAFLQW